MLCLVEVVSRTGDDLVLDARRKDGEVGAVACNAYYQILVLFLVDYVHEKGIHIRETIAKQHIVFRWLIYYAAILAILIFGIYGPAYNASSFIYGNF